MHKEFCIIPGFEINCPYCKHKLIYEKEYLDAATNIFCHYCSEKIDKENMKIK